MAKCIVSRMGDGTTCIKVSKYPVGPRNWIDHLTNKGLIIEYGAREVMVGNGLSAAVSGSHEFLVLPPDIGDLSRDYVSNKEIWDNALAFGAHVPRIEHTFVLLDMILENLIDGSIVGPWVVMHAPIQSGGRDLRFVIENEGSGLTLGICNGAWNVLWRREDSERFVYVKSLRSARH